MSEEEEVTVRGSGVVLVVVVFVVCWDWLFWMLLWVLLWAADVRCGMDELELLSGMAQKEDGNEALVAFY